MKRVLLGLLGAAAVLVVWQVLSVSGRFDSLLLPTVPSVIYAFATEVSSWHVLRGIGASVWKALAGFALATAFGVPVGLGMGLSRPAGLMLSPTFDFMRSIPATALMPLFFLFFGFGAASKVAVAFYPSALLIVVGSYYGATSTGTFRRDILRQMGASSWQVFRHVLIFEALPNILAAMRMALSLCLVLVVVAEIIVPAEPGIGRLIYDAQQALDTPRLYARIAVAGVIGFLLNEAFGQMENRIARWEVARVQEAKRRSLT
jgi:ABC-type nitrate/sulfonate/bicarbonate transport system permease component